MGAIEKTGREVNAKLGPKAPAVESNAGTGQRHGFGIPNLSPVTGRASRILHELCR